jgi:hypothetical protein
MRGIAFGLALFVISSCGGDDSEASTTSSTSSTTTTAATGAAAFPGNIPTDSDGECSQPRTDPARPSAGPLGKITDGVTVERVNVVDGGPNEVVVTFTVSSPPYVKARSGERWVVTARRLSRGDGRA